MTKQALTAVVVDAEGNRSYAKPSRVRRWLDNGKAVVIDVRPFTVRLLQEKENFMVTKAKGLINEEGEFVKKATSVATDAEILGEVPSDIGTKSEQFKKADLVDASAGTTVSPAMSRLTILKLDLSNVEYVKNIAGGILCLPDLKENYSGEGLFINEGEIIRLSDFYTKEVILRSRSLRVALKAGWLMIINEADLEEALEDTELPIYERVNQQARRRITEQMDPKTGKRVYVAEGKPDPQLISLIEQKIEGLTYFDESLQQYVLEEDRDFEIRKAGVIKEIVNVSSK